MSRLARALVLAATLAAMTLAGLTDAAQAHPASDAVHPSRNDARRQALAQERYYSSFGRQNPATQAALAQERYYSSWRPGGTTAAVQPATASRQPGWPAIALGMLAAAVMLAGALAAMTARRARRRVQAHKLA
jgi:hypothetical protein